jgi:protein-S-isoprenylcysteine O-methyltransferase Ste14
MNETKKVQLLDWAERLLLTVLYVGLVYRLLAALGPDYPLPQLLVQIPAMLSEGLLLVFVWIRRRSKDIALEPLSWLVAFTATSLPLLAQPHPERSLLPAQIIVPFYFSVFFLQLFAKFSLGRSFGVVPANRGVKSDGLYRFVRHPIYASYLLHQLVFFFLIHPSWFNTLIFVLAYSLQIPRLLMEEELLSKDPEYVAYQQKVRYRLFPGIF